jgi:YD repeat-containing protein
LGIYGGQRYIPFLYKTREKAAQRLLKPLWGIKMRTTIYISLITLLLVSCNSERKNIDSFYNFDYDYELRSYYSDDLENHKSAQFYKDDKLIRRTAREGGCEVFHYDSTGRIMETTWGRNCEYGRRTIFMYDSLNNHIGYYSTMDSVVNLDTVKFEQILFYNTAGRLIKERTAKRKDMQGVEFEIWKFYAYTDSLIQSENTLRNSDTLWDGEYSYNSNNELIKIHRTRDDLYETELFKYNENGLLIEKEITSTENPVTPVTSFSAGNNKRTYKYDSDGILTEEAVLNHEGKVQIITI